MANNVIKRTWNQNKMVCIEDLSGMAFQSESGGHTFEISGTNDSGTAVSLSGTVEARFLRADNVKVTIAGTISNGKASVTLTSNCYTVAGRFSLTIFVTSDSQKVAVYSAVGNVVVTDGVSSGTVPPLVTDSIQTGSMTASGDVTVNGVLDVISRRCYAWLSSPGWYRVMELTGSNIYEAEGAGGFIVDFNIVRNVDTANNEAHKISLMATLNNIKFINEQSVSNILGITKIRTTHSGSNLFVDVYYGLYTGNTVTVAFNVTCLGGEEGKFNSQPFTSVDPSPAGETVLSEYTFIGTSAGKNVFTPSHGTSTFGGCWYSRNGEYVTVHVGLTGITANTNHIIGTLPVGYRPVSQCCSAGSSATYEQLAHLYVRENGDIEIWSPNTAASLDATFMWR